MNSVPCDPVSDPLPFLSLCFPASVSEKGGVKKPVPSLFTPPPALVLTAFSLHFVAKSAFISKNEGQNRPKSYPKCRNPPAGIFKGAVKQAVFYSPTGTKRYERSFRNFPGLVFRI